MNLSLKGKTALICGGSQGLGLAAAQELALLGANCILLARSEAMLKAAVEQLDTSQGQQHSHAVADFSQTTSLQTVLAVIMEKHSPIHVLVNNSGGPKSGPITEAEPASFINAFIQHVVANQVLTQAVLPGMRRAGYGRIINIVSTSVRTPLKNLGVSNTIRGAVASWAKSMANELGRDGITVNNVLPGATQTERLGSLFAAIAAQRQVTVEEVACEWLSEIPLRRFGEPQEVGALVAFLASPAAGYISGESIRVDGGRTPSI